MGGFIEISSDEIGLLKMSCRTIEGIVLTAFGRVESAQPQRRFAFAQLRQIGLHTYIHVQPFTRVLKTFTCIDVSAVWHMVS
jgi:hypothetical protein